MVGSRIPGPLGIGPTPPIDDGTLALTHSPLPGLSAWNCLNPIFRSCAPAPSQG